MIVIINEELTAKKILSDIRTTLSRTDLKTSFNDGKILILNQDNSELSNEDQSSILGISYLGI